MWKSSRASKEMTKDIRNFIYDQKYIRISLRLPTLTSLNCHTEIIAKTVDYQFIPQLRKYPHTSNKLEIIPEKSLPFT